MHLDFQIQNVGFQETSNYGVHHIGPGSLLEALDESASERGPPATVVGFDKVSVAIHELMKVLPENRKALIAGICCGNLRPALMALQKILSAYKGHEQALQSNGKMGNFPTHLEIGHGFSWLP